MNADNTNAVSAKRAAAHAKTTTTTTTATYTRSRQNQQHSSTVRATAHEEEEDEDCADEAGTATFMLPPLAAPFAAVVSHTPPASMSRNKKHTVSDEKRPARGAMNRTQKPGTLATTTEKITQTASVSLNEVPSPSVNEPRHVDVQTESPWEELTELIEEVTCDTQTDFEELPPDIPPQPTKTGVDQTTQIEPQEAELLFNFDRDIGPVVDSIVGRTLQQALLEVLEEEELKALRQHRIHFEQRRNHELDEIKLLEDAEKKRVQERGLRIKQLEEQALKDEEHQKQLEAKLVEGSVAKMAKIALDDATRDNHWGDPIAAGVAEFMPVLHKRVEASLKKRALAYKIVDGIIAAALAKEVNAN
ncbi:flagellar radial spoke protein [Pelomyxa schiedti]|nr:flagellar radial spoke protein [Pelomyxa schiedti]